jgi:hypothetical protein
MFWHTYAGMTVEHLLGDYGLFYDARKPRPVSVFEPFGAKCDARFPVVKRVFDGLKIIAQARPNPRTGNYNTVVHL